MAKTVAGGETPDRAAAVDALLDERLAETIACLERAPRAERYHHGRSCGPGRGTLVELVALDS